MALEQLIGEAQQGMLNYQDLGYMDCYIKPFEDIEIQYNEKRREYFCDLPAKPIELYFNKGVKIVQYMKGKEDQFAYMPNNNVNLYHNLPSFQISGKVRYYVEGQKLFFSDHIDKNTEAKLLIKLLTLSVLDDEDELPIQAGKELQFLDLIFQMMMKSSPKDDITDNQNKVKQ